VVDKAQSSQAIPGAARYLRNWRFSGANKMTIRAGTRVAFTLQDDAGTPAPITDVCALQPFADGALAVGYSSTTQKAYLYRFDASMTVWTDSGGTTHTTTTPTPVGVLWTGVTETPEVTIAEGLGTAYIAHTAAMTSGAFQFATKTFVDSTRAVASLSVDLQDGSGAVTIYFMGVVSFQQHLWGWGFGATGTIGSAYRPEMARFSQPIFGTTPSLLSVADSITLGNRVRSLRETIVGGYVAGQSLFLGGPYLVSRITGYGRSSWYKQPLESSYGFVSHKCAVAVGGTLYWWSPRGPVRCSGDDPTAGVEPLFDRIQALCDTVVNPQNVVAGFDIQTDTVIFSFDTGSGVRTWAGYDVRRDVWVGPDQDWGVTLRAMGTVSPIYVPTASAPLGPGGPPTTPSTTGVGATTATANWVAGDALAATQVEVQQQSGGSWVVEGTVGAGLNAYTFSGLSSGVAYQWRAKHVKDGISSTYLGPVTATQFTTTAAGGTLNPPTSPAVVATDDSGNALDLFTDHANCNVTWNNSGETGADTIVEMDSGSGYVQQADQPPGSSSCTIVVTASGTYNFRMKHTRVGYTDSAYTTPVSVTVSIS